jgi:hypothetical protein
MPPAFDVLLHDAPLPSDDLRITTPLWRLVQHPRGPRELRPSLFRKVFASNATQPKPQLKPNPNKEQTPHAMKHQRMNMENDND